MMKRAIEPALNEVRMKKLLAVALLSLVCTNAFAARYWAKDGRGNRIPCKSADGTQSGHLSSGTGGNKCEYGAFIKPDVGAFDGSGSGAAVSQPVRAKAKNGL
jgi:hypothetical protein